VRAKGRWREHPARAELRRLYAEVDVLVSGCECACSRAARPEDALCCQFGLTGREPYPTPIELCEVDFALRAGGGGRAMLRQGDGRRALPLAVEHRTCPLLSREGRCTIYESRPFGCRTYFCAGHEPPRRAREAIQAIGRRVSDLAARAFPRDPRPRPFTRALAGTMPPLPE
jgi:Fe-S-cluster containining protein